MNIMIYYLSGNISVIDTTILSYQDGLLVDDAYLDASDLDGQGLLLDRGAYDSCSEGRLMLRGEPIVLVSPEELQNVGLVTVAGSRFLTRQPDGGFHRDCLDVLDEAGAVRPTSKVDSSEDRRENRPQADAGEIDGMEFDESF